MRPDPRSATVGERLAERRRALFVGRAAEIELFRAALAAPDPPFSVLFLHGPGGIGKSALLDRLADAARETGARIVRLEVDALVADRSALASAVDLVAASRHGDREPSPARAVVLVDGYERAGPMEGPIRDELVAGLPGDAIAVLASRLPPQSGWDDPVWRERLRTVALRGLPPAEAHEVLHRAGVPESQTQRLAEPAHGHPLALGLLADLARRDATSAGPPGLDVDLVTVLLHRLVDVVPGPLPRQALQVCALARVTTQPLLRDALGVDDAVELFDWLHGLSFVDAGPEGLQPHELARDVLDLDLRWRDPEGYRAVFRRVRAHVHGLVDSTDPRRREQAMFDVKFIFRNLPGVLSPVDWASWGTHRPEPATPGDHDEILQLVARHEGDDVVPLARDWLGSQPEGFMVLRGQEDRLRGFVGLLDLTAARADQIAADPPVAAAWAHAHRGGPIREGEMVTQTRFVIDRECYQDPSPTLNAVPVVTLKRYLEMRRLAFDYLTLAEPESWDDYFRVAGLPRVAGGDTVIGRHRFGLFCHDFRAVPISAMIDAWEEQVLAQDFHRPAPSPPGPSVPDRSEFAANIRQALGDLHRADLLERSALLRTRLLVDRAAPCPPDGAALAALLLEAAESLRDDPRDDRLWQAIRRTYLVPAGTQESAAASLGLPFSTYRRHLSRGRDRIVEWCWQRELHG
jgi:hypothetical protein